MDPQIVLMLAGGTLLLLNGFIGRGLVPSQGESPVVESVSVDPNDTAEASSRSDRRSLLEDWG